MWLGGLEGTSYVLIICVLVLFAVFAVLIFGSLPCSCKYLFLLNHCPKSGRRRRSAQVGDSSTSPSTRSQVVGSSRNDEFTMSPRYSNSGFPFTVMSTSNNPINENRDTPRGSQVTFVTLSPGHLPHYYEARVFKAPATIVKWTDEPPPTYESLFNPINQHQQIPSQPPPLYSSRRSSKSKNNTGTTTT